MHALVLSVSDVSATMTNGSPHFLMLHVTGLVPTTGWSEGQLVPAVYSGAPDKGVWDWYFMALRPTGIVSQVRAPIAATLTVELPQWCRAVRICASTNAIEQALFAGQHPNGSPGAAAPGFTAGLHPPAGSAPGAGPFPDGH